MKNKTNIGVNIKRIRKGENLTQEQLAEMSDLSTNFISRIERSESQNIGVNHLIRIADALQVNIKEFFQDSFGERTRKLSIHSKILIEKLTELDEQTSDEISEAILTLLSKIPD
ncbi:MAG: helix-turn-helix transcriptional regulator [Oenococcus sp.]|uniref:helix-turn-helix domain-containing protein n=1 Tax=Oenococcus sp. TaxID=1979414 RepID=UPI0039EA2576